MPDDSLLSRFRSSMRQRFADFPQYRRKSDGACVRAVAERGTSNLVVVFEHVGDVGRPIVRSRFRQQYELLESYIARGRFEVARQRKPRGSKYVKGDKFADVLELCAWILDGKPLFVWGRVQNASFMRAQQLHTLVGLVNIACKAVPK